MSNKHDDPRVRALRDDAVKARSIVKALEAVL